jgi:hypothetical protein
MQLCIKAVVTKAPTLQVGLCVKHVVFYIKH